jgi:hypothetical protein
MSWGTCNSGSNNIHFNYPPIMADGRNYSTWQPGAVLSNNIRKREGITQNWEYRNYMINNAENIMKQNKLEACNNCGSCINDREIDNINLFKYDDNVTNNGVFSYGNSDLKNLYITRQDLQSRLQTPVISQDNLYLKGFQNYN